MTKAGPIVPVRVLSASDLRANGGSYVIEARAAIRIEGFTPATTSGRDILGDEAIPVYIISDSDLRTNGGSYALDGDPQELPVINTVAGDYNVKAQAAIPVYVVSPSGWPNVTPPVVNPYSFLDQFTTAQAAPLTTPRTAIVGSETITDPDNSFSIAGGVLVSGDSSISAATGIRSITTFLRVNGLALVGRTLNRTGITNNTFFGFYSNGSTPSSSATEHAIGYQSSTTFNVRREGGGGASGPTVTLASSTASHWVLIVLRSGAPNGALIYDREGDSGDFTLRWVHATSTLGTLITMINSNTAGSDFRLSFDDWGVWTYGAPFTSAFSAASFYNATPVSGDTATGVADGFTEIEWTPVAAESLVMSIRRTDDNNRWTITCNQAGSLIILTEVNAGVPVIRSSVAQTWTAGTKYRLFVRHDGQTIATYASTSASTTQTLRNNYATASFNPLATGIAISGGATIGNFAAWNKTRSITIPTI